LDLRKTSLAMGRNAAYMRRYLYRGSPKVLSEADRIAPAEHLRVDEDELRHQARPCAQTRPTRRARRVAPATDGGAACGSSKIAEIDVLASAGPGALLDGFQDTKEVWSLPEAMIHHQFRARTGDLRIITDDGDSREPELSSGDQIMVDTSQRVPVPPGIFLIWDGHGLPDIGIQDPVDPPPVDPDHERAALGAGCAPAGSRRRSRRSPFADGVQHLHHRALGDLALQARRCRGCHPTLIVSTVQRCETKIKCPALLRPNEGEIPRR
jgi:hypothetical protein